MKNLTLLFVTIIGLLQPVFANETLTSNIKYALKRSTDGSYVSVFFALGVVILLIYITGIIYAKLNVFGYKTMKKQYFDISDSKLIIRSTTPIGNNKSLLVVELAGKKMLIGVTNDNITLIKDLDEKDNNKKTFISMSKNDFEKSLTLDKIYPSGDFDEEEDVDIDKKIPEEDVEEKPMYDSEEFGLYKKYLD